MFGKTKRQPQIGVNHFYMVRIDYMQLRGVFTNRQVVHHNFLILSLFYFSRISFLDFFLDIFKNSCVKVILPPSLFLESSILFWVVP